MPLLHRLMIACALLCAELTQGRELLRHSLGHSSYAGARQLLQPRLQKDLVDSRSITSSQQLIARAVTFRGRPKAVKKATSGVHSNAGKVREAKYKPELKDGNFVVTVEDLGPLASLEG